MAAEDVEAALIAALTKGVGPKEVRTPNMTVVAHDIGQVQRVMERRSLTAIPTLCNLGGCRTVPNESRYRMFNEDSDSGCGCD